MHFQPRAARLHGLLRADAHEVALDGSGERGGVIPFPGQHPIQFVHQTGIPAAVAVPAFHEFTDGDVLPILAENAHFDDVFLLVENDFALRAEKADEAAAVLRERHHRQRRVDAVF